MRVRTCLMLMSGFLVAAGVSAPADAELNPIVLAAPVNNSIGQLLRLRAEQMQREFDQKYGAGEPARRPAPSTPSGPVREELGISSDADVSALVHREFYDNLARTGGAAQAQQVDEKLGNIRETFSRMLRPYGLRADDFGDVEAAHLVVMWMAVNQQTRLPTASQVQAVRRQMRTVFASQAGAISGAGQRQSVAEYIMYETCMAVLVRTTVEAHPELLKAVADAANEKMLAQGIPLRSLALTDDGLVTR